MAQAATSETTLFELIGSLLAPLGYEAVHIDVIHQKHQNVLRVFIDHLNTGSIGIEDCVKATHALDEPLEKFTDASGLFGGAHYEIEISSPGINRPLRGERDFSRFTQERVRIHTFRPLEVSETENPHHFEKHPKQKNFLGINQGVEGGKVILSLEPQHADMPPVRIPLGLVSKAHLEPNFETLEKPLNQQRSLNP